MVPITSALNGQLVETKSPKSYAVLLDLPKLPLTALDALDVVTFTTVDSKLHSYKKVGLEYGDSVNKLYVHFAIAGR